MQDRTRNLILESAQASSEGRIHFGQVVAMLTDAGVESYRADYRTRQTTYYLPDGQTLAVDLAMPDVVIADNFDADAVKAAIRGSQQGAVKYPEFKRMSCAAGCVGYTVWIAGRHVTYVGRRGEMHEERFPD